MKEVIKIAVKYTLLALFLAMPDILRWISSYIGEFLTWVVFIFIIGAVIIYCVSE